MTLLVKVPVWLEEHLVQQPEPPVVPGSPSLWEDGAERLLHPLCVPVVVLLAGQG